MNILHVFPFTHFCVNYIAGFRDDFNDEKHFFWLYGGNDDLKKERDIYNIDGENVVWNKKGFKDFERLYNICDIWVMQSIPDNLELCELIWRCYSENNKPFVIVPWGRELCRTSNIYYENPELSKIVDKFKRAFLKECSYCLGDEKTYDIILSQYNINPSCKIVSLNSLNSFQDIIGKKWSSKYYTSRNNTPSILIGHRGTITSNHTPVLEYIYNKGYCEIEKVICPLSYGDEQYMAELELKWSKCFKDKWISIKKWVNRDEWLSYLNETIDIAVFNSATSEGINTIFFLLFLGKKIFINPNSDIIKGLNDLGVSFYEWNNNMSFNDFLFPLSEQEAISNKKIVELYFTPKSFRDSWKKIFDDCLSG